MASNAPFHPERADIDVRQNQRDEQNGDNGVGHLGKLHVGDVGAVEWKQQQKPGGRDGNASSDGKPVDHLLTEIEASGRRVLGFDEAATLLDPVDIDPLQKIVREKDHGDQEPVPQRTRNW